MRGLRQQWHRAASCWMLIKAEEDAVTAVCKVACACLRWSQQNPSVMHRLHAPEFHWPHSDNSMNRYFYFQREFVLFLTEILHTTHHTKMTLENQPQYLNLVQWQELQKQIQTLTLSQKNKSFSYSQSKKKRKVIETQFMSKRGWHEALSKPSAGVNPQGGSLSLFQHYSLIHHHGVRLGYEALCTHTAHQLQFF